MAPANIFAYVMLLVWPLVVWLLYRRLDPSRALIWSVLAGYLVLPPVVAIDFPVIPDFTKNSIPPLAALIALWFQRREFPSLDPGGLIARVLIALYVASPFLTVLGNGEPITFLQAEIRALRLYDSVALVATQAIGLMPFFLARRYLADDEGMKALTWALVLGGLVYSAPMLLETAVSPQINIWVYGFFQHDFFQTIRAGGYRPVVFLPHGLWVALFAFMAAISATVWLRVQRAEGRPAYLALLGWMVFMVVICKSLGALAFLALAMPAVLFLPQRWLLIAAASLALIVVTYPVLRGLHLVPLDDILALASRFSEERASSLSFRIQNEEALLAHAAEKPLFGWGGFTRSFLHDPITGRVVVIADGAWIIVLGMAGWVGYAASFGLLALPLGLLGLRALKGQTLPKTPFMAAVAVILGFNLLDMLPNATDVPLTWLMAGALYGQAERLRGRPAQGASTASRVKVLVG